MATNPIAQAISPFIWGRGGAALTPEQVAREREVAEALMAQGIDTSPVGHWTQGAARMANVLAGKLREGRASSAETAGRESQNALRAGLDFSNLFGGGSMAAGSPALGGSPAASTAMAAVPAPDIATARVAQAHGGGWDGQDLRSGIVATAEAIGADPIDLATAISYETAGTFDPTKRGPTTQWGQHRGLIQFGEPQARQYGVDWNDPIGSQLGPDGAVANYFRSSGFKPGMSGLDLYSTINAGAPGRYGASDANNGGAPGNVRDKWENQMAGHRQKAMALLGDYAPSGAVAANEAMASGELANPSLTSDAVQQWAAQNYAPEQASGATVAETPEEILAAEAAMAASPGAQPRLPQAAPPLPEPTMVQDMPVADIARSLTAATVNPDLPMAGNTSGFLPIAQSLAAQQQGGGMPPMQQIMELASSPWATDMDRQIAGALIKQQMEQADPYRQAQLEKLRLETEALRNPAAPKPIEVGGVLLDPTTFQPIFDSRQNDGPASVQEYQFYANQMAGLGQQPLPYDQWDIARRQSAATQVNVGSEGQRMGTIPAGMAAVPDPNNPSGFRLEAIPGGPAAIDEAAAAAQRDVQTVTDAQKAETTLDATRSVLDILDNADTPATGTLSRPFAAFSGTPAGRIRSYVGTLQSGVALGAMQRLKEASATGATGFGALSEKELDILINDIGALNPDNTEPDIFRKTIERIQDRSRRVAEDIAKNVSPERIQELGLQPFIESFSGDGAQDGAPSPGSVVDGYRFKGGDPADPNNWEKQ